MRICLPEVSIEWCCREQRLTPFVTLVVPPRWGAAVGVKPRPPLMHQHPFGPQQILRVCVTNTLVHPFTITPFTITSARCTPISPAASAALTGGNTAGNTAGRRPSPALGAVSAPRLIRRSTSRFDVWVTLVIRSSLPVQPLRVDRLLTVPS